MGVLTIVAAMDLCCGGGGEFNDVSNTLCDTIVPDRSVPIFRTAIQILDRCLEGTGGIHGLGRRFLIKLVGADVAVHEPDGTGG